MSLNGLCYRTKWPPRAIRGSRASWCKKMGCLTLWEKPIQNSSPLQRTDILKCNCFSGVKLPWYYLVLRFFHIRCVFQTRTWLWIAPWCVVQDLCVPLPLALGRGTESHGGTWEDLRLRQIALPYFPTIHTLFSRVNRQPWGKTWDRATAPHNSRKHDRSALKAAKTRRRENDDMPRYEGRILPSHWNDQLAPHW